MPGPQASPAPAEHVEVLVVGAGLAGIGAAARLLADDPGRSLAVLEAREHLGGTWDLFRYPGVRSDSDMYSLGFRIRPWPGPKSIAEGSSILAYLRETADEHHVSERIRYRHRVRHASWSSADRRWQVEIEVDGGTAPAVRMTCDLLYCNTGYYRFDGGYTPDFEGTADFAGRIVHPQDWPADLDVTGARVVVIGSGATAVTLVPALAGDAARVTMLQRSPSYVLSLGADDPTAAALGRVLPARVAARLTRAKNVAVVLALYRFSRRAPGLVGRWLRRGVSRQLPAGYDVATHFTPRYRPWDQRLCVVPDGDLFRALRSGRAEVVTGRIERFTRTGVRLESGTEIEADLVVTATGLRLLALGGIEVDVDGEPVDLGDLVFYKGVMLSRLPNFVVTLGYAHAPWTLKADLTAIWVVRLLRYMRRHGYRVATPGSPDPAAARVPFANLTSGYLRRSAAGLPRFGVTGPWRGRDYPGDALTLGHAPVNGPDLHFSR